MNTAHKDFLSPEDIALLDRVLIRIAAILNIKKASTKGNEIAVQLIDSFKSGATTEEELVSNFMEATLLKNHSIIDPNQERHLYPRRSKIYPPLKYK